MEAESDKFKIGNQARKETDEDRSYKRKQNSTAVTEELLTETDGEE